MDYDVWMSGERNMKENFTNIWLNDVGLRTKDLFEGLCCKTKHLKEIDKSKIWIYIYCKVFIIHLAKKKNATDLAVFIFSILLIAQKVLGCLFIR